MHEDNSQGQQPENSAEGVHGEGRLDKGFIVSMMAAGQTFIADEPTDKGGSGHGPDPYAYLSMALASCTIMTLNMYAARKDWPLESVRAEVRHGKVHATDCENCENTSRKVDRFDRVLHLEGDLDDEQRQRLLEIANRCPVHRTLHEEVEIHTSLAE